ncbi:MAG: hypothetical protein IIY58_06115 [Aeriscardovia sp.]|nr:hypothetical protein [Aeriscardovia sp.]
MKISTLCSQGDDLKKVQGMLIKAGYSCGSYGAMEAALIGASSIDVDGGTEGVTKCCLLDGT